MSEIISKYFFKPNGEIEIPPPGAIINGVKIVGLRRPASRKPKTPIARKVIVIDDDDDEQTTQEEDEEEEVDVIEHEASPIEVEDLSDDGDDDDDDDGDDDDDDDEGEEDKEEDLTLPFKKKPEPIPAGKQVVFVENEVEYHYVCTKTSRRPNEEYIMKERWSREEIQSFLQTKLGFSESEVAEIIDLSKQILRTVSKLHAEYKSYSKGYTSKWEFAMDNAFDYRQLNERLARLYDVEKRPRQHTIMILAPGSKPRFISSDVPGWMTVDQKRASLYLRFCPPHQPVKRVLYWMNSTADNKEPLRQFGDQRPCDIASSEPKIDRNDHITTAFMRRYWKLERLFTIPEFF